MTDTPKDAPSGKGPPVIDIVAKMAFDLKALLPREATLTLQFQKAVLQFLLALAAEHQRMLKQSIKGEKK